MISLLTEIQSRLNTALSGDVFSDPSGAADCVPMVKIGGLDPKRAGSTNDEDFPFVVVRPMGGEGNPRKDKVNVQIIGGIWTEDDVIDGFTDIDRLASLILSLANVRGFDGWMMTLPSPWQLGDEDGQQPHPYYYVTVNVSFLNKGPC